jgi:hypothetical protein
LAREPEMVFSVPELTESELETIRQSTARLTVLPQPKVERILPIQKVKEAVVNIAGSTPTKDFAISMCKFFEENPNAVLRVRAIGAGSGHQLTKSTIEANKLLASRGQMISRYDFWTNENGKSVNNTRIAVVAVMPSTLAQTLQGTEIEYIHLDAFMSKNESEGGDK